MHARRPLPEEGSACGFRTSWPVGALPVGHQPASADSPDACSACHHGRLDTPAAGMTPVRLSPQTGPAGLRWCGSQQAGQRPGCLRGASGGRLPDCTPEPRTN
ncbi:hypothetical protein LHK_01146 [Laribacter hongkongensis HLHK9]|uniref:Uncharacterized protein n=1 Tax=Laribacter hongkongensis (strain HLHK9) TaxID=557598 RepID=C1D6N1_LARHH|nr:hypothetical protein LHK_01146 [Laribacter hongkongensis HLHK9]